MNDDSLMPHGQYKGRRLKEIPLDHFMDEWEAGNLNAELRHYVVSKVPILAGVINMGYE